jgi:hypothetical protein
MAGIANGQQWAIALRVECLKSEGVQPNDFRKDAVKWL